MSTNRADRDIVTEGKPSMQRLLVLAAIAAVVVFALLAALNEGQAPAWTAFDNIGQLLAAMVATVACVIRAKRERSATSTHAEESVGVSTWQGWASWSILAAGMGAWTAGQAGWSVYEIGFGVAPPSPSLLDIAFLSSPVLIVIGLLAMVRTPAGYLSQLRGVIEGLFIAAGFFLCSWDLITSATAQSDQSLFGEAVNLAYPVLDAVALSVVLFVALRRMHNPLRGLGLLGMGIACLAISDSAYWYLSALNPTYPGTTPVDTGWVAGFLLIAIAALKTWGSPRWVKRLATNKLVLALPPLPAAVGILLVLSSTLAGSESTSRGTLLCIVTIVVLLSVALMLVVTYENHLLTRNLEGLVDERTAELHAAERFYRALVQRSSDAMILINPDMSIRYVSSSIFNIFEFRAEDLTGRKLDAFGYEACKTLTEALEQLELSPGRVARVGWKLYDAGGRARHAESTITNLIADPHVGAFVLNTRDDTDRVKLAEELRRQAFHDPLTDLANRALLSDRASQAFARARRSGQSVAIMVIDLDSFKLINDGFGHQTGDLLLSEVGRRITDAIRPEDTAARLGGDEFVVLMDSVESDEGAMILAERIRQALSEAFVIHDGEHHISASIGVAIDAAPESNFEQLLCDADVALYVVKGSGKNAAELYQVSMHEQASERFKLQNELREALEHDQFSLVYQPEFNSDGTQLEGFEALVRWNHPEHGLLTPDRFIPLAEETGLIVPLGRWVLERSLNQLATWDRTMPSHNPLNIAVNVSTVQLSAPSLTDDLRDALGHSGIAPERVVLEITETALIDSSSRVARTLEAIKQIGVRLAIDDFGTGYASVAYLQNLPVDILKIDQSFVLGSDDEHGQELLEAIVNIGRVLSLVTIAEGVEQPAQLETVKAAGCDLAQGYLLGRPLTNQDAQRLIAEHTTPTATVVTGVQ